MCATFSALSRSRRSGRTNDRATSATISSATTIAAIATTASRMAVLRCAAACSATAAVTDDVVSAMSASAIPSVAAMDWLSSGLFTSTAVGLAMIAIRRMNCSCSCFASAEPTPRIWLIPNSVDGSVPATVFMEVRSSGSGTSPPRLTSSCCIII